MKSKFLWAAPILALGLLLASFTLLKSPRKAKKTFVLVHGAWAGKYAWDKVKPLLEKDGNKVIVFDLPAHGDDQTPISQVTIDSYIKLVSDKINKEPGKVILVGHSLAGMTITQVAENIPDKLDKLVYLSAFLPQNGQFVLGMPDSQSLFGPNLILSADKASATLPPAIAEKIFAPGTSPDIHKMVLAKQRPEPLQPFTAKAATTAANFGRVPKYYIETLQDVGVGPKLQEQMIQANGQVVKVFKLDCGHDSYFAKPVELAAVLNGL
ncbi:MAG: alpha/beta fold hydrolase [Janthinobacterium lividum]